MTNSQIADAFSDIYNGFWLKWRGRALGRHSLEWDRVYEDAVALILKYPGPLTKHMVLDLMDILEGRVREQEEGKIHD